MSDLFKPVEGAIVEAKELTTHEAPPPEPTRGPLADLRQVSMALPKEQMELALAEYAERRKTFREWLLAQMQPGVHFGVPPGCEPRDNPDPRQWQHKPSLYKAGADLLVDLMAVRAVYRADLEAWRQLGEPTATYVFVCELVSRATSEVIAEGRGAFKVGEKKMQENAALKMAQKRARIDATINAWGLSDLFTQDLDEDPPPLHANPTHDSRAPRAAPRGNRLSAADLSRLINEWKSVAGRDDSEEAFRAWVHEMTGIAADQALSVGSWSREKFEECMAEIERLR